jgi:hypothetical protein
MKSWRIVMWIGMTGVSGCGEDHPAGAREMASDGGSEAPADAATSDAEVAQSCPDAPSYAELRSTIFDVRCTSGGCHTDEPCQGFCPPGAARGRVLFAPSSTQADLVNVAAEADARLKLVVPGDPDDSLLVRKLIDDLPEDQSLGEPMPLGEAIRWQQIPQPEVDAIRCWIQDGAR